MRSEKEDSPPVVGADFEIRGNLAGFRTVSDDIAAVRVKEALKLVFFKNLAKLREKPRVPLHF